MAEPNNPKTPQPAAPPQPSMSSSISKTTLPIAGLQVDIYGLAELPTTTAALSISCLWLHHPRLSNKERMASIADETISAFNNKTTTTTTATTSTRKRGLIAVAFDQRNHGTRLTSELSNHAWRQGNATHAQDMFGIVSGTVVDTVHLLDALEGYIFGNGTGDGNGNGNVSGRRHIDSHLVLGVSLGGHSAWQLLFAEPRVTAGVMVIGCPDYMSMLQDRARLSKLGTFTADEGASFLGSKDFPASLVGACKRYDPKAILFGAGDITTQPSASEQTRLREILDAKIRGKRFQVLSGGADKLVPYKNSKAFLDFLKPAVNGWYKDGHVYVEDNVYPGIGHEFSAEMHQAAIQFILDTVYSLDAATSSQVSPKI